MTDETSKVLEELRGIVNNFTIRGSGVSGNLVNGYAVIPGSGQISGGGGGGGGGGCGCCLPAPDTINISFSGVSSLPCTGCVFTSHGAVAGDINSTFTLPKVASSSCKEYFSADIGTISIDIYNDFSCVDFNSTVDAILKIDAVCYNDGSGCKWFVEADLEFFGGGLDCALTMFISSGIPVGDPIINQCPGGAGNCASTGGFAIIT